LISISAEGDVAAKIPKGLQEVIQQLHFYFEGKPTNFSFKINPSGTEFQKRVWVELLKIPYGKTTFYLDLSKKLGD
jgi:methylated-DNA-[protein]-cysteine S-methyltransferase